MKIKEKINSLKTKKVSIALSGGVDSTLVLELLKKNIIIQISILMQFQ